MFDAGKTRMIVLP